MPKKKKLVYFFGGGKAEGKAAMRELLGGKGAGLHEMTRIGAPVPPGFTITTEVCSYYYAHHRQYPKGLAVWRHGGSCAELRRFSDDDSGTPTTLYWSPFVLARASQCRG